MYPVCTRGSLSQKEEVLPVESSGFKKCLCSSPVPHPRASIRHQHVCLSPRVVVHPDFSIVSVLRSPDFFPWDRKTSPGSRPRGGASLFVNSRRFQLLLLVERAAPFKSSSQTILLFLVTSSRSRHIKTESPPPAFFCQNKHLPTDSVRLRPLRVNRHLFRPLPLEVTSLNGSSRRPNAVLFGDIRLPLVRFLYFTSRLRDCLLFLYLFRL